MKLIERTEITDSNLISTNVAEDDQPIWLSGTPYVVGDKRMVLATHGIYEALIDDIDKYPPDNLTGENPAWLFTGTTNARKMFNQSYAAQTVNTGSIQVVMDIGRANSIGVMNVEGSTINAKINVGEVEIYNHDIDMRLRTVTNWYEYIYTPIELKSDAVLTDLPASGSKTLTLTIAGSEGQDVKCGLCIPGFATKLGDSLWGCQAGTDNYSRKVVDVYGGFEMMERGYSKTLSDSIFMPNERTGYIQKLIQPYYTKPALWVAEDKFGATHAYGPYQDFSIVLADPSGAQCSITVIGLT